MELPIFEMKVIGFGRHGLLIVFFSANLEKDVNILDCICIALIKY